MIANLRNKFRQSRFAKWSQRRFNWTKRQFNCLHQEIVLTLLRRSIISMAIVASLLAAVYWLAIASDRYVSETRVIVQRTDLPGGGQGLDFTSLLGGASGSRADQLLLRDHLLSQDMLKKLDATLDLRSHYSDPQRDLLSRMWSKNDSIEDFYRHYLSRVSIEMDDFAGILVIKAQGYDAKTAQAIATFLVQEGGNFINGMAHSLAQGQVDFLEQQVVKMNQRAIDTRQDVLRYQNKAGLVSPQFTAENITAIVAKLEAQRTELETQRSASEAYLVKGHPSIVQLDQQIAAVAKQIAIEQAKLTAIDGKPLNRTVEQFQRLEMDAAFAQDVYKTALVALEKGRIEATRTIKKVSMLQTPTMPEDAMQPRRYYNTLVFMLLALLLAGVLHLLTAIVRDHKD
jgi:capsular polysaccharide transport system permease protein